MLIRGVMGPDALEEVFTEKRAPGPSATERSKVFSARSLIVESKFLQISFTYGRDRSEPNKFPCGAPWRYSDNNIPVHKQTFTHY
jgi:hypothetical protein